MSVVSQPDRPKGRNRKLAPCPLKELAVAKGLPILDPEKIGQEEVVAEIRALEPDIIVLVAYGQYVPQSVLTIPKYAAINLHPSLLPTYRGAAPVQMAIAEGQSETGVTILYISDEMDAGDIILQESMPIGEDDTSLTMAKKLADLGARLILDAIDLHRENRVHPRPQDSDQVTVVHKLKKEDGRVDWTMPAEQIRNRMRGFQPWPGCFCEYPAGSGAFLRIHEAVVEEGSGSPGEVIDVTGVGPLVATGEKALRLLVLQPSGKKAMPAEAFLRGHSLSVGTILP